MTKIKKFAGSRKVAHILNVWKDSVLETLLVVDSTTEMTPQNLWNFIVKFGSKVEIC
jgi:hypothetical protein